MRMAAGELKADRLEGVTVCSRASSHSAVRGEQERRGISCSKRTALQFLFNFQLGKRAKIGR